jgi:hypothetical protein
MKIEIDRIFNNKCLCFGIDFHWGSFLGAEIVFMSYNLTIIIKEPAPEFLQNIKSYVDR